MTRRPSKPSPPAPPGRIDANAVNTLQEFSRRTGCGERALRSLRRAGLPVRRVAGRCFVLGSDFLELLDTVTT